MRQRKEAECGVRPHPLEQVSNQLGTGGCEGSEVEADAHAREEKEVSNPLGTDGDERRKAEVDSHTGEDEQQVSDHIGEHENWMKKMDDELMRLRRPDKVKLSRGQKRKQKSRFQKQLKEVLDMSMTDFKMFQVTDPTLESLWERIRKDNNGLSQYFQRDGLLYRRWMPSGRIGEEMLVEQLVHPSQCRRLVIQIAHLVPMAGHLGRDKTTNRILQRFYWPTIFQDVANYCKSCGSCQKTTANRLCPVPLIPLPIVEEPFKRIAMDIVGPLPKSRSGKRYILVICDYATRKRWPYDLLMLVR